MMVMMIIRDFFLQRNLYIVGATLGLALVIRYLLGFQSLTIGV